MKKTLSQLLLAAMMFMVAAKKALAGDYGDLSLNNLIDAGNDLMGLEAPYIPAISPILRTTMFVPLLSLAVLSAAISVVLKLRWKDSRNHRPFMILAIVSAVLAIAARAISYDYGGRWNLDEYVMDLGFNYSHERLLQVIPAVSGIFLLVFLVLLIRNVLIPWLTRRKLKQSAVKGDSGQAPPPPAQGGTSGQSKS